MKFPKIILENSEYASSIVEQEVTRRTLVLSALKTPAEIPLLIPVRRSLDDIFWIYAAWQVGRVFIPIPAELSASELARVKLELGTWEDLPREIATNAPSLEISSLADRQLACLVLSSGTSSAPKLVALTRGAFKANAAAHALHYCLSSDDIWLASLPFSSVGGLAVLMRAIELNQDLALPQNNDAQAIKEWMESGRVQGLSLVPTQLKRILNLGDIHTGAALKVVLVGGAKLEPSLAAQARHLPLWISYGMTETCSQVWAGGRALAHAKIKIDSAGEICIKSASLAAGYWREGRLQSLALDQEGFFATGDLGRWSEEGQLEIVGRRSNMIISGGVNISPEEIETGLRSFPGVNEVCVIGIPDSEWGERLVAILEGGEGINLEELRQFMRKEFLPAKRPKEIFQWPELPRTPSGKIIRGKIVEVIVNKLGKTKS